MADTIAGQSPGDQSCMECWVARELGGGNAVPKALRSALHQIRLHTVWTNKRGIDSCEAGQVKGCHSINLSAHVVMTGSTEEEWKHSTKVRYEKSRTRLPLRKDHSRYEDEG